MEAAARPPNPALPYREDCWSDGETAALVEAWGERYVELGRGNLRQQHWQEVAEAVNARRRTAGAARRPPRTDVQCKNRIDTLKKKYKAERAKINDSGGADQSQWHFFSRLDSLIGPSATPAAATPPLALPLPLPYHRQPSPLPHAVAADSKRPRLSFPVNDSIYRRAAAAAAAAATDEDDDNDDSDGSSSSSSSKSSSDGRFQRGKRDKATGGGGVVELARAIERFGDIYERVEGAKQRQVMELEKQRMEFAKALEFERMQIFVDTQIQLAKLKRAKRVHGGEQGYSISLPLFMEACRSYM